MFHLVRWTDAGFHFARNISRRSPHTVLYVANDFDSRYLLPCQLCHAVSRSPKLGGQSSIILAIMTHRLSRDWPMFMHVVAQRMVFVFWTHHHLVCCIEFV